MAYPENRNDELSTKTPVMTADGTDPREQELPSRKRTPLWKRVIPFLIAGGILTYLFLHLDMHQVFEALLGADVSLYVPWLVVFILASFLLDTQNLAAVINTFRHEISFRDALAIRGVTYLLMTIDYSLGLGALIYYMRHDLDIPVMRSTSIMLFFNTITQLTLVVMAIIGLLLLPTTSSLLKQFLILSTVFVGSVTLFVFALKRLPSRGYLLRIKNLNLIKVFHEASWESYLTLIFWRGIYYWLFIGFFYGATRAFYMNIPLIALVAYVPIILLIISMPITPCGFGTAQAAMIYLFKDYGTPVSIMAFGLTYSASIILFRSLIGLFFANNMAGLVTSDTGK